MDNPQDLQLDPAPQATGTGTRGWLAGLLGREPRLAARFAYFYARLGALSRARRRLARRAAGSLAAAALLLALSGAPALAATITVANGEVVAANNGKCSLVEAIANANDTTNGRPYADCAAGAPSGADTINLPSGGSFSLTTTNNVLYGNTGLPAIHSAITIQGNGSTIQRAGGEAFRLLAVSATGNLTLDKVTLKNGLAEYDYGGAILAYGNLTVRDSTLSSNAADAGGAIFAYGGEVHISGSQIAGNNAYSGSGLSLQYVSVTISNSTISGNEGTDGRGGGGIYFLESEASIASATISGNSNNVGGGILSSHSTLVLSNSQISGNAAPGGLGGGLYLYDGQATIINTAVSGNNAAKGGGIYHYAGTATLQRSLVATNQATSGGGIHNAKGTFAVVNTTLSGNTTGSGGGATNLAVMALENATVTGNAASSGNGGGLLNQGAGGEATLRRSIIAGNTASGQGREVFHSGKSIAGGHFNVFGFSGNSGVSGFTPGGTSLTPSVALNGILNPSLADNGGPTRSHLPAANSPAIDRSPTLDCFAAPVSGLDQRGQPRNRDANDVPSANECDIGAIEAPGTLPERWEILMPFVQR